MCAIVSTQSENEAVESGEEEEEEENEGGREKYPCGKCSREVRDDDEAIYCESGCEQWYHR